MRRIVKALRAAIVVLAAGGGGAGCLYYDGPLETDAAIVSPGDAGPGDDAGYVLRRDASGFARPDAGSDAGHDAGVGDAGNVPCGTDGGVSCADASCDAECST